MIDDHDDDTRATHVAFVAQRSWVEDVSLVLERASRGQDTEAARVLEVCWRRREMRLSAATVLFSKEQRAELGRALEHEPELAELAGAAPDRVRRVGLARALGLAPRLDALRALNAPEIVLEGQRRACRAALTLLDPRSPYEGDPAPASITEEDPATGLEVPALCPWLGHMLAAAQADATDVGLGEAFHETPEAKRFLAESRELPAVSGWPGLAFTTMGMRPDLAFWLAPRVALPRVLSVPPGSTAAARFVVAEASGPVTCAFAEDAPLLSPDVDRALSARTSALTQSEALVSFVWLVTPSAGAWQPY